MLLHSAHQKRERKKKGEEREADNWRRQRQDIFVTNNRYMSSFEKYQVGE